MDEEGQRTPRRRGVGRTLPVGWKHMSPPSEEVRHKILQQIMERVKKEEQASAERAARAEERKNEKEKSAWHKQQIEDCNKKIENVNCRKTELDDLKSRLFAELKEVVAKDKAQKATLSQQGTLSQAKEKHETPGPVDSSTTNVNAQQLDQSLHCTFDKISTDSVLHNYFGYDLLVINEQFKMLCGDLMSSSEELQISPDCDENISIVPPNTERASDWAIASVHETNLPASKNEQMNAECEEKWNSMEKYNCRLTFTRSLEQSQHVSAHFVSKQTIGTETDFLFNEYSVPKAVIVF